MMQLLNAPPAMLAFLLIMSLLVLCIDLFAHKDATHQLHSNARVFSMSLITLFVLLIWMIVLYPTARARFFAGHFIWDPLSALLGLFIVVLSILAFIYARDDLKSRQIAINNYYILGLFSILGMLVLVSAGSMLSLYLGLELMSLPLYAMVALERNPTLQAEAAMKYIVMGAVASAFLLYGFSLIYSIDHSLMLTSLLRDTTEGATPLLIQLGLILIVAAIAFKLGVAPFHFWVPDVYQAAPVGVGLFIGTAPKLAVISIALRLTLDSFPHFFETFSYLFMIIATVSVIMGNLIALTQTHIRRLLAYSSIAHMGYIMLGLSAKIIGSTIAVFYSISYGLMTASAFGVLATLNRAGMMVESIEDLRGLHTRHPRLAFIMLLTMFSMAGIPPLIGFWIKLGILQALLSVNQLLIAGIALLFSVIGAYYYLNVVKYLYFEKARADAATLQVGGKAYGTVSINAILLLGLGLFPDRLIDLCRQTITGIPSLLVEIPRCLH